MLFYPFFSTNGAGFRFAVRGDATSSSWMVGDGSSTGPAGASCGTSWWVDGPLGIGILMGFHGHILRQIKHQPWILMGFNVLISKLNGISWTLRETHGILSFFFWGLGVFWPATNEELAVGCDDLIDFVVGIFWDTERLSQTLRIFDWYPLVI
jgi:hypothetical protein